MESNNSVGKEEYEKNLLAMKKWNERRAESEKNAMQKFWALRSLWNTQKKVYEN